eukprot:523661-Pyramimonas_sp.AAC.1
MAIVALTTPSTAALKASLSEQLEQKRRELQNLKPVGQKLDSLRAALERSRKRKAQAAEALSLAEQAVRAATEEERLDKELTLL